MKISNIIKINANYIKNNFWDVLKMCRLIILSLLLMMLTQRITSQFQNQLKAKVTEDYMIYFHNQDDTFNEVVLTKLNILLKDIGFIQRMDRESSRTFHTKDFNEFDLDTLNLCEGNLYSVAIINTETRHNYKLNKNDLLIKDGLVYQIIDIQDYLQEDKEVILCDGSNTNDTSDNFILKIKKDSNLRQDLALIKRMISKKTLIAQEDISLEKIGSKEIINGLTAIAKQVIDMLTLLIALFSLLSIVNILELVKLKRAEEFEILKYNGLFEHEEKLMNITMMLMLLLFCYGVSCLIIFVAWNGIIKYLF